MIDANNAIEKQLKPLPTTNSDIGVILNNNMLYVDKTKFAYEMIKLPGKFFLSRPRRFGKSMLLSTFKEIFLGHKELFKDQWIYNSPWDWQVYPIIRLDFNVETDVDLHLHIKNCLKLVANAYDVFDEKDYDSTSYGMYFRNLIVNLSNKFKQQVVVLIDEYDKPILDLIDNIAAAEARREILKGFYTIMKGADEYLRFVFLTGVSRFSKVGIFSGLNNLQDISMDDQYADICGITQDELELHCKDHIQVLATANDITYPECLTKIREWYNGFCFCENGISVYNPFSTMNVLVKKKFGNYWFSSGNASSIIKLIQKQPNLDIFQLDQYPAEAATFDTFDITNLNIIAILFQAGYLTIKAYDRESEEFTLGYSNREVEVSFKKNVLSVWSNSSPTTDNALIKLTHAFNDNDIEAVIEQLQRIFVNIDYDIKLSQENNYQSVFYLILELLGLHIKVEYKTNRGRIDALIETKNNIYIFEFKLDKTATEALTQIKEHGYADRFVSGSQKPLCLVGVNFNSTLRNIDDYIVEAVKP